MITLEENIHWIEKQLGVTTIEFLRSPLYNALYSVENLLHNSHHNLQNKHTAFFSFQGVYLDKLDKIMEQLSCKVMVEKRYWIFFKKKVEEYNPMVYQKFSDKDLDILYVDVDKMVNQCLQHKKVIDLIKETNVFIDKYNEFMDLISATLLHYKNVDIYATSNSSFTNYLADLQAQYEKMVLVKTNLTQYILVMEQMLMILDGNVNYGREVLNFILSVKQAKSLNNFDKLLSTYESLEKECSMQKNTQ